MLKLQFSRFITPKRFFSFFLFRFCTLPWCCKWTAEKLHNFHEMEDKIDVKCFFFHFFALCWQRLRWSEKDVNGLLKCHYLMCHTDLLIDYWLLSFVSLMERRRMSISECARNVTSTLWAIMGNWVWWISRTVCVVIECNAAFSELHCTVLRRLEGMLRWIL